MKYAGNKYVLIVISVFTLLLFHFNTGFAEEISSSNISLVIAVDNSSSMSITDPASLRTEAVKLIIDMLAKGDEAGIVQYGSKVKIATPIIKITDNKDRKHLKASVKKYPMEDYTRIDLAIDEAEKLLRPSKNSAKAIILISDGALDVNGSPSSPESISATNKLLSDKVNKLKREKIKVYTLAMTNKSADANSKKLQEKIMSGLAKNTGGIYKIAPGPAELHLSLIELIKSLSDPPLLHPEKGNGYIKFTVDPDIRRVNIIINKKNSVKSKITLKSPHKTYSTGTKDSVLWTGTGNVEVITLLETPAIGVWEILSDKINNLNITIIADTDYRLSNPEISGKYRAGGNIKIEGNLLYRKTNSAAFLPYKDEKTILLAEILTPDNRRNYIELDKKGTKGYSASYTPEEEGKYEIKLVSKGKIKRESSPIIINIAAKDGVEPIIYLDQNVYALGEQLKISVNNKDKRVKISNDALSIISPDKTTELLSIKKQNNNLFLSSYKTGMANTPGEYKINLTYTTPSGEKQVKEKTAFIIGEVEIATNDINYGKISNSGSAKGKIEIYSELELTTLPARFSIDKFNSDQELDIKEVKFIYPGEFFIRGAKTTIPFDIKLSDETLNENRNLFTDRIFTGTVKLNLESLNGENFSEKSIKVKFILKSIINPILAIVVLLLIVLTISMAIYYWRKTKEEKIEPVINASIALKAFPTTKIAPKEKHWEVTGLKEIQIGSDKECLIRLEDTEKIHAIITIEKQGKEFNTLIKPAVPQARIFINKKPVNKEGTVINYGDRINISGYVIEWSRQKSI